MTQIIGLKSCLHNLINLQFPHNRSHCAVPRSYCVAPPRPAMQTHHCLPQQDALPFTPFPPKSPLSLPDACCRDTNVLLLLSSLSKHRQEGKRLTVCLVPYATWQQSLTDMAGVWATAKGSFFDLFYSLLPCMCLCLGRKCETKSPSGPHQAGFTVWAQPEQGAALIVICAIFQTVLTIGMWKPLIVEIASPKLM